uniref:BTB domain-containing protein n=1 Tax=Panagrolaimus davidi TaxID=227884 RepID=A0A914QB33_9BILA
MAADKNFFCSNVYENLYLNTDDDADTTFLVHGQEVKAHKCIIAKRSEALKVMINSDLAPADGRHVIADEKIKVEDFKEFLRFLYLDNCEVGYNNLGALLHMSDMYLVPFLKLYCLECVEKECRNIDGIFGCSELAILYEDICPEMLQICFEKLSETPFQSFIYHSSVGQNRISAELLERIAKDCPRSAGLNEDRNRISAELLERIAKDCPRSAGLNEDRLLMKIFEWGQQECKQQNIAVDPTGMKKILSPIVKHMKFGDLSIHSLTKIIYPNQLAPTDLYIQYLVRHLDRIGHDVPEPLPRPTHRNALERFEYYAYGGNVSDY